MISIPGCKEMNTDCDIDKTLQNLISSDNLTVSEKASLFIGQLRTHNRGQYLIDLATENQQDPSDITDDEAVFLYQQEVDRLRNLSKSKDQKIKDHDLNVKLLQELCLSLRHLNNPEVDPIIPAIISEPSDDPALMNINPDNAKDVLDIGRAIIRDGEDFNIFGRKWLDNPMVCFMFKQHMFYMGVSDEKEVIIYPDTQF